MVARKDLKSVHEAAVLQHFKEHLGAQGIALDVLATPEPPEAIVEIGGVRTWIEITDAFLDQKHAIALTSGACHDTRHIPDDRRLIVDPDEVFASVLRSVIAAKYDKATMRAFAASEGPGVLLVGVFTPFATAAEVANDEAAAIADLVSGKADQIFDTIYVYDGYGRREFHVLYG